MRAFDACVRMLCEKLDLPKRRVSTSCNLKAISCKVTDDQGASASPVMKVHRSAVSSHDFICPNVDGTVVEASKSLKETLNCKARILQRHVCEAERAAGKSTPGLFADTTRAVDRSLGFVIERASGKSKLAIPNVSSSRIAI